MTPLPLTARAEPIAAFPAPAAGTVPTPLAGTVPAPPGRRAVAHLLDAALVLPGVLVGLAGVLGVVGSAADPRPGMRAVLVLLGLLLAAGAVGAQAWTDATRGWTAGKRAMDLRTVAACTGAPVGRVGDLLRGWYDLAEGTLVIDVRDGRDPTAPVVPGAPAVSVRATAEPAAGRVPAAPPVGSTTGADAGASTATAVTTATTAATVAAAASTASTVPLVTLPIRVPLAQQVLPGAPVSAPPALDVHPFDAHAVDQRASVLVIPALLTHELPAPVPSSAAEGAPAVPTPRPAAEQGPTDVASPPATPSVIPVDRLDGPWVELALSDGRTVTVAGSALLGRDPVGRAGEVPGTLVTMDDPERAVSKTHLAVGVDASGAWVVDRRSTNGTVVTLGDGQQIICVPEQRVRLTAGVTVGFGGQSFAVTALATAGGPSPAGGPAVTDPR